jgi:hypothetical protein
LGRRDVRSKPLKWRCFGGWLGCCHRRANCHAAAVFAMRFFTTIPKGRLRTDTKKIRNTKAIELPRTPSVSPERFSGSDYLIIEQIFETCKQKSFEFSNYPLKKIPDVTGIGYWFAAKELVRRASRSGRNGSF